MGIKAILSPTIGRLVRRPAGWCAQVRRHGAARGAYSVARKFARLPGLGSLARVCAADLWQLDLQHCAAKGHVVRGMRVEQAGIDDVEELARFFGCLPRVQARLEQGRLCYVARSQAGIGAGVWIAPGPGEYAEDVQDLSCVCRFPAKVGWSFDGKGTRLGAWGSLMARLPELLGEQEIQELFALIEWNNWRSLDSHRSLGYQKAGAVACLSLWPFVWPRFAEQGQAWQPVPGRLGKLEIALPPREL